MSYPNPSPLNFPQSCTSVDPFPPNTPVDHKFFLDSNRNKNENPNMQLFPPLGKLK